MTPEQISMVESSFAVVGEDGPALAHEFYRRLFTIDPSAKELFTESPDVMAVRFSVELKALVDAISSFPDFAPRVRDLGRRHAGYRVRGRHYHAAREALIGALAEHLGDRWSNGLEAAWRRAYNLVAEMMMAAGAAQRSAAE